MKTNFMNIEPALRAVSHFQRKTFGEPSEMRISAAKKLCEEASEYLKAVESEGDKAAAEELADVVFMIVQACDSIGFNLADEVFKKLRKNEARKWQYVDGVYSHEK